MSERNTITGPNTSVFYGDKPIRWFVGTVVEKGNDEPRLGRVKVRIEGVHGPDVSNADIPYAQVLIPTTEAGTSGLGWNSALERSATVFGIFLDGKQSQLPLVLGSIPVVHMASATQIAEGVAWSSDGSPGAGAPATVSSAISGPPSSFVLDPNIEYGSNIQYAWSYLRKNEIFSDIAIAALIGNFCVESGGGSPFDIRPSAEGDKGLKRPEDVSIGIAQWYNGTPRQRNLLSFAKAKGGSPFDLSIQLQFVEHEWTTVSFFNLTRLNNYKQLSKATVYVHHWYETPAKVAGAKSIHPDETYASGGDQRLKESARIGYARDVFDTFTRSTPTVGVQ
jgi:hypothetical protein